MNELARYLVENAIIDFKGGITIDQVRGFLRTEDSRESRALLSKLIDDDGVVVTESGAILLYLARKSGKLMPRDPAGEAQVMRWSIAALTSIEVPVLSLWFVDVMGGRGTRPSEALRGWADMRLEQLDGWLADRQFVATDEFTVADILLTHVLGAQTDPELLKPRGNILAYRARCTDRPAWKKTLDAYHARVEAT